MAVSKEEQRMHEVTAAFEDLFEEGGGTSLGAWYMQTDIAGYVESLAAALKEQGLNPDELMEHFTDYVPVIESAIPHDIWAERHDAAYHLTDPEFSDADFESRITRAGLLNTVYDHKDDLIISFKIGDMGNMSDRYPETSYIASGLNEYFEDNLADMKDAFAQTDFFREVKREKMAVGKYPDDYNMDDVQHDITELKLGPMSGVADSIQEEVIAAGGMTKYLEANGMRAFEPLDEHISSYRFTVEPYDELEDADY